MKWSKTNVKDDSTGQKDSSEMDLGKGTNNYYFSP